MAPKKKYWKPRLCKKDFEFVKFFVNNLPIYHLDLIEKSDAGTWFLFKQLICHVEEHQEAAYWKPARDAMRRHLKKGKDNG